MADRGYQPFEPFMDSLRIAVPLVISQRKLDADKEQADTLFSQRAAQILLQANETKNKFAIEEAAKLFEKSMENLDQNDPENVRRTLATGKNLEAIAGQKLLPRDEAGNLMLPGVTWKKPGMTEYQKESLDLRSQLGQQSALDREEARKDRMALAGQAAEGRKESLNLRRDILEEQKQRNLRGEQGTKPRQGYMWNDDRSAQIPIPGTDADRKQKLLYAKEKYAYESVTTDLDKMIAEAEAVKNHKGLEAITGRRSYIPNFLNQDAQDAQARLDSLKSQVFVGTLNNMRKQSATGGAVGSVTEKEGDKLEATIASLKNAQSAPEMKAALQRVIDYSNTIKTKLGNAFSTWDEIINPQGASPVTEKNLDIRTSDDYLKKFGGK